MGLKKYEGANEQQVSTETAVVDEAKIKEEQSEIEAMILENEAENAENEQKSLDDEQKEIEKEINEAKQEYLTKAKKQRRLSTIISVLVLVLLVGTLVLMLTLQKIWGPITYVCLGVMVLVLAGVFVSTKFFKNRLQGESEKYINKLFGLINGYIYREEKFAEKDIKPNGQMRDELFLEAGFYKEAKGTKSRNLVMIKYNEKTLGVADLAGFMLVKGRTSPLFLGRYFDYENSYSKEGCRILMQVKGGELSKPLDNLEGLEKVSETNRYVIYSNDKEWEKTLTSKIIKDILQLKIDKTLIDVIVSIRPGKTDIGIDYSDEFMNIPVETEFNFKNVIRSECDVKKVINVLDQIK